MQDRPRTTAPLPLLPLLSWLRGTAFLSLAVSLLCGLGFTLAATAQVSSVSELVYPPLPPFEIAQPERVELANGMVVMLLPDRELPLIRARALVRAGSIYEPAEKVSLSDLTGEVLRTGGAGERGPDEIDEFLEARAASVEVGPGNESTSVNMTCLSEDFTDVLAVFADILRRPRFAEDRLEIARTSVGASIARQNDNPLGILFREIEKIVYGESSPWARRPTWATLGAVTREDLVTWHQTYFHPDRIILGLTGDFDTATALAAVKQAFGDWPQGPPPQAVEIGPYAPPEPAVYFAEKADVTQSFIAFGTLGIRRDDPDYYPLEILNQILSGGFGSRLFSNIRTGKGLAYSVSGQVGSAYSHPDSSVFWLSTKTETTGAGIEALREELRGMISRPPTEEEVEKARGAILNSFVFNSDSRWKTLNQQLTFEFHGYPLDWLSRYRSGLEGVTVEQVRAVAKKTMTPETMALLVVGRSEGLDRPLSDFGAVRPRDLSIPPPPAPPADADEGE